MNIALSHKIIKEVSNLANEYAINKIVLFGSRARGDHKPTSDIDLAIYTLPEFHNEGRFVSKIEDVDTLLKIDVVFIDNKTDKKLIDNIEKEGIVIYERL